MQKHYFQRNRLINRLGKAIIFLLIGVIAMDTVGCGKIIGYEELGEKLLEEKYNDEFVVENVQTTSMFEDNYTVVAYQKDDPTVMFKATVDNDGSYIADNYVTKLVCKQLSDTVAKNLDSLKGYYYIYSSTIVDSLELEDPSTTLNEYVSSHPKMKYNIYVFYCPDDLDKENTYSALSNMFSGLSISGNISLYIMNESMMQKTQNYLENHDKIYDEGKNMFSPYYCGMIEFTEGALRNSREEVFEMLEDY